MLDDESEEMKTTKKKQNKCRPKLENSLSNSLSNPILWIFRFLPQMNSCIAQNIQKQATTILTQFKTNATITNDEDGSDEGDGGIYT